MSEEASLRDVAHEQLDDNKELVHGLEEPRGGLRGGSAANGLLKVCVGGRVVELDDLDSSEIVMVSRQLRVSG